MSADLILHIKPAPADPAHSRGTDVRLCSFPPSQRGGAKRFLSPAGERVVCRTSAERMWWLAMVRSGDVIQVGPSDVAPETETWSGPAPIDKGPENVPAMTEVTGGKKGK